MNVGDWTVLWSNGGGSDSARRIIGRDPLRAGDRADAMQQAARMLLADEGSHDGLADGFYVRRTTDEEIEIFAERGA